MMEKERELLSTEIVTRGIIENTPSFSVRVRRGLPDFLSSVNLKYVKLGYGYLISHANVYVVAAPLLLVLTLFGAELGKNLTWEGFCFMCDVTNALKSLMGLLVLGSLLYIIYLHLTPRSTYLIDFACYLPPKELKISKKEYMELARKSKKFDDAALEFQQQVLKNSGLGDETYLPRVIFHPDNNKITLKDGREEAAMVIFGAVDDLIAATGIRPKDIKILIVNCAVLNTTPSISAMVINHYKLSHDIQSFNLGGMGCAAGIIAIDLARDLLNAYSGSYALVVSTEVVSFTWYNGNDLDMVLPNCFFRMGAAAVLLSSRRLDRLHAKYELKQLVRTHKGMENKSFKTIRLKEDSEGKQGLSISKDVIEVGGHALKANITTLGPLVLPLSEQLYFFISFLFKNKTYIPNYKLALEHFCIAATSKRVLDEIQKSLELNDKYMEASRKTLERFGNTSSSSVWYELAYLEANKRVKKGDRVLQIGLGSGFKCNSVVWRALRSSVNGRPKKSPWIEEGSK